MYIAVTSHTESDRFNEHGFCKNLETDKQTFDHLRNFFEMIEKADLPVTQSLMTGGPAGSRLLEHVVDNCVFPKKTEKSIHMHAEEKWIKKSWKVAGYISNSEAKKLLNQFKSIVNKPKSCVFGHFMVNDELIKVLSKNGVKVDGSYSTSLEKFSLKQPFTWKGVTEVPVVSNMDYPLNPFLYGQHMHIIKDIIRKFNDKKIIMHTYFHSYDFFYFKKNKIKLNSHAMRLFFDFVEFAKRHGCKFVYLKNTASKKYSKVEINDHIIVPKIILYRHRLNKLIRIAADKF